jgi:hypothetical protein
MDCFHIASKTLRPGTNDKMPAKKAISKQQHIWRARQNKTANTYLIEIPL